MRKGESGQALVLVLLSLSVVLTIVLFVLSRSVTDISTSTEQADSVRAFSAAEAGIERALITGSGSSENFEDASYSVSVSDYSKGARSFNYPAPLLSGETMTNWFVSHDPNTGKITCDPPFPCFKGDTLKVCWGNPGSTEIPAVEVSVYYKTDPKDLKTVQIARAAYDPTVIRAASNSFSSPVDGTCQIGGVTYAFQKTITMSGLGIPAGSYNVANGLLFAKIRMLYNTGSGHVIGTDVNFASNGNSTLPSQGLDIVSTGTSGTSGNLSNRRVSVFRGWPEFPFSGLAVFYPYGGITK